MITNHARGHKAEQHVAHFLQKQGYKIRAINWKTRYCEIDIVAEKHRCVYFVEVKYRETSKQGTGLDYITPKKLQQMTFAAELWLQTTNWMGDCCLMGVEVSGDTYSTTEVVEL